MARCAPLDGRVAFAGEHVRRRHVARRRPPAAGPGSYRSRIVDGVGRAAPSSSECARASHRSSSARAGPRLRGDRCRSIASARPRWPARCSASSPRASWINDGPTSSADRRPRRATGTAEPTGPARRVAPPRDARCGPLPTRNAVACRRGQRLVVAGRLGVVGDACRIDVGRCCNASTAR